MTTNQKKSANDTAVSKDEQTAVIGSFSVEATKTDDQTENEPETTGNPDPYPVNGDDPVDTENNGVHDPEEEEDDDDKNPPVEPVVPPLFLPDYIVYYPESNVFHVTSDRMIFLDYERHLAVNHQATIEEEGGEMNSYKIN